jgi:hypothetical protein
VSIPMDGGVNNSLSRPTGTWSAETGLMKWALGDVPPSDNPGTCYLLCMWWLCMDTLLSGHPSKPPP